MKKKKAIEVLLNNSSKATNHSEKSKVNVIYHEDYNDTITFLYNDTDNHRVYVVANKNQLSCMRIGESNTFCQFIEGFATTLVKDSELGTHILTTKALKVIKDDDKFQVVYDLFLENDYLDTITMSWEIIRQ